MLFIWAELGAFSFNYFCDCVLLCSVGIFGFLTASVSRIAV